MNITKTDVENFVKACRAKAIKTEQDRLCAYLSEFAAHRPVYHNIIRTVEQYNNIIKQLKESYGVTKHIDKITKTFWVVGYCCVTLKNEEALAYMDITKNSAADRAEVQHVQKLVDNIRSTYQEYDKLWENIKRKKPNSMVQYLQKLGFDTSQIDNQQQDTDIDRSRLFVCGAKKPDE